jgi:hypothetical protein
MRRGVHDVDGSEDRRTRPARGVETSDEIQGTFGVVRAIHTDDDVAELTNGSSDNQHGA